MGDTRADLLLHPVRIRIVQASVGREVTTADLAAALPDLATATLYRHVRRLAEAGVLEVVDERPVRGTVERTYRLATGAGSLGAEQVAAVEPAQHVVAVQAFVAGVLQAATRYLDQPGADPANDGFGYRQIPIWADENELAAFVDELRDVVARAAQRGPADGRRRRTLTTILVPDTQAVGTSGFHDGRPAS